MYKHICPICNKNEVVKVRTEQTYGDKNRKTIYYKRTCSSLECINIIKKERSENLKKSHMGIKMPDSQRLKRRLYMLGNKINIGKKHSKEHKEKIRQANFRNGNRPPVLSGKDNHLWRGGITKESQLRLCKASWKNTVKEILKRDGYKCCICGKKDCKLQVHHIIPYRIIKHDRHENLQALCESCHHREDNRIIYCEIGGKNETSTHQFHNALL